VRGNSHARFLEGWTGAIPSSYSIFGDYAVHQDFGILSVIVMFRQLLVTLNTKPKAKRTDRVPFLLGGHLCVKHIQRP